MQKLKTELLLIGRSRGDSGSNEEQRQLIDVFFLALQAYLTPSGIQTFTAEELRVVYTEFGKLCMTKTSMPDILDGLSRLIHLQSNARDKPLELGVSSDSVVDIFSRRS